MAKINLILGNAPNFAPNQDLIVGSIPDSWKYFQQVSVASSYSHFGFS